MSVLSPPEPEAPAARRDRPLPGDAPSATPPTRLGRRAGPPKSVRVALALSVCALPLLRPSLPGNSGLADVFMLVAVGCIGVWLAVSGRKPFLPYTIPVGLWVVAGGLATVAAGAGATSMLSLGQDLFLLLWCVGLATACRDPATLRTVVRAWAISACVWAGVLVAADLAHVNWLAGITARDGTRAALTLGDANLAANYFLVSLFVLRAAKVPRRRWLRWACIGLVLTAMVFTGSNGATLALIVATSFGCLVGLARRRGAPVAVAVGCAGLLAAFALANTVSLSDIGRRAQQGPAVLRDSIGRMAESDGSRAMLASESLRLWESTSLTGIGPGQVKTALLNRQSSYVKEAHDDYAAALIERGLLGGVALVALLTAVVVRATGASDPRRLPAATSAVIPRPELLAAALLAVLISGCFYEVLHFRQVWGLFALIAVLDSQARRFP